MKKLLLLFFLSMAFSIAYAQKSIIGKWKQVDMLVLNKETNKKERNNAGLLPCVVTEFLAGGKMKSDTKTCAPNIQQMYVKLDATQRWVQRGNKATFSHTDNKIPPMTCTVSFKGNQLILDYPHATIIYQKQ